MTTAFHPICITVSFLKAKPASAPILTIRWRRKNMSIPKILPTNLWYCLTVVFSVNRLIYQNFQQALTAPKVILHSSQLHTVKNLISSQIASSFLMRQAITASDNIIPLSLKKPLFIKFRHRHQTRPANLRRRTKTH